MSAESANDSKWIAQLKEGDRLTFANIFNLYGKELYEFASRTIYTKEDCEEIVQDVFVSLWERRE